MTSIATHTQPLVRQLAHVCLLTTDLKASEDFYTRVLGLEKAFDFIREGKPVGFYLKLGGQTFIEVFQREQAGEREGQHIAHLCLEVHSVDDAIKRIRAAGVTISDRKRGKDQSWQAWTADPQGVKIELHEYTPQSSQVTGSDCVF
jgi:lactoylglutathione lyase/glyoxylase I family protein